VDPKIRAIALFVAVNIVSVVCLVWALHGVHFRQLFSDIAHLDWRWANAAIVSNLLVYIVQAWRWSLVLAPVTPVSVVQSTRAVFVGLYANEVLPLRSGEIIRCYLQARWSEIPISVTLASALIERIFDGIWLIVGLFVALRLVQLPRIIRDAGIFLAILVLVCAILLAIAMFWREQTLDALVNAPGLGWAHILIKDLHLIGHSRFLYYAFFASLPCLLLQVFPVYAVMQAFNHLRDMPLTAPFVITIVLRLNSVLPQAPGNVGTFQWATIRSTLLFGVARNIAQRFSFILWGIVTLPIVVVGFIAVGITGLKIGQLQRDARSSMQNPEDVPQQITG
jgi:hypothetical protein